MWNIIVCDGDETEREQITEYIRTFCGKYNREVSAEGCADWPELMGELKRAEPDLLIVAQNGVGGLDTITSSHLPPRKIIWFSDLDFGVQSYRLCLFWFSKKPVTYQKIEQILLQHMGEK